LKIRFEIEAAAELAEAVAYYDGLLSGLGSEFAAEIRSGLRRIEEHPKAWPLIEDGIRRYRLNRFPYEAVNLSIFATFHLSQIKDLAARKSRKSKRFTFSTVSYTWSTNRKSLCWR
jgi:hypothetical protein